MSSHAVSARGRGVLREVTRVRGQIDHVDCAPGVLLRAHDALETVARPARQCRTCRSGRVHPPGARTPFNFAGRATACPRTARRRRRSGTRSPLVGLLEGRAEPHHLEPAQSLGGLVTTDERARVVGTGIGDLLAHGAGVDGELVAVRDELELADLDGDRRVRLARTDRVRRVDRVGGLGHRRCVTRPPWGPAAEVAPYWRQRLGSSSSRERLRGPPRSSPPQRHADEQEEGGDRRLRRHRSVFAQQIARRLPACHSASWNHV